MRQVEFFNAIHRGDKQAVARLLAENPSLIEDRFDGDWTALHWAVWRGHDDLVAQLLVASPSLVSAVSKTNLTALQVAMLSGPRVSEEVQQKIAAHLLAARPSLIDAVDVRGFTALHHACQLGSVSLASMFLAIKPDLAFATSPDSYPAFVCAMQQMRDEAVLKRLLEVPPDAVHRDGALAFSMALKYNNDVAIGLIQPKLTFGDILWASTAATKSLEPYRPVMESQCEALLELLNRDVLGIVQEFLGFETRKRLRRREGEEKKTVFMADKGRKWTGFSGCWMNLFSWS